MVETAVFSNGLDGIVVAETDISEVDGERGRLIIKGFDAEEIAFSSTFENTCALLWPGSQKEEEVKERFGKARLEAHDLLKDFLPVLRREHPMDALRAATSLIHGTTESDATEFARIAAALAVFAAAYSRLSRGLPLVRPETSVSHAEDYLRMIRGENPTAQEVKALDTYLTTVSDHGMNASTFTARVVASTASDNVSCVVAAIGALKGPLHGGAPGPVLDMLNEVATAANAGAWLSNELDSGRRIMGMGHRVYKVRDPRAAIFEKAISRLEEAGLPSTRLELARAVEKKAEQILAERHPERPLKANVEFYTAVLLDALKIPGELFSATFAVGRVGGWLAHVAEQRATGRLIRPSSRYVGKLPR